MNQLQQLQYMALETVNQVIEYAQAHNLINTQEFLDFLDKLNELSVTY